MLNNFQFRGSLLCSAWSSCSKICIEIKEILRASPQIVINFLLTRLSDSSLSIWMFIDVLGDISIVIWSILWLKVTSAAFLRYLFIPFSLRNQRKVLNVNLWDMMLIPRAKFVPTKIRRAKSFAFWVKSRSMNHERTWH